MMGLEFHKIFQGKLKDNNNKKLKDVEANYRLVVTKKSS